MSTEQEISEAEREALIKAFEGWTPFSDLPMSDLAWVASREFGRAAAEVQKMEYDDMRCRLDIALEHEVACAEQRQRADMAEEREKGLRKRVEDLIIQLSKANDPINDYAVQTLMIALGDA